jgi:hypothetical protein
MRRRPSERARTSTLPICAALAVLLALWGQLAGVAHMALVAHVECPDHAGEMVHGDADHDHGSRRLVAHDAGLQQGAASEAEHAHEHCSVAAHRADQLAHAPAMGGQAVQIAPPALARVAVSTVVPAAPELASAILALAPKTSPPHS